MKCYNKENDLNEICKKNYTYTIFPLISVVPQISDAQLQAPHF